MKSRVRERVTPPLRELEASGLDAVNGGVGMSVVPSQVKVILTVAGAYKK